MGWRTDWTERQGTPQSLAQLRDRVLSLHKPIREDPKRCLACPGYTAFPCPEYLLATLLSVENVAAGLDIDWTPYWNEVELGDEDDEPVRIRVVGGRDDGGPSQAVGPLMQMTFDRQRFAAALLEAIGASHD